ncbi:adenylate/guanylate cyclase domain-containing protein [Marinobacterium nitratireducens]|uniref:Adenylate/guanylate cyclase domain-containing protein n=1 Tax=Marinobacterium nitratireducens TaxID=518897 RepID=A0A918DTG7_9GAMM|nr:adenylate/guanylate cyclase domain-containing protein [Marinobacterium nitratireducens]GGO81630.1 adenylate/guanylate cyclase domain-containing protein [Marinobacterium nitratireducens]
MRCAGCGFENPRGVRFCKHCGGALAQTCSRCGHNLRPAAKFCDECGAAQAPEADAGESGAVLEPIHYPPRHLTERILASQSVIGTRGRSAGERKIVTALFADMAGSTALVQNLDPEEVRSLIDPVLTLMMEAVHHYEGYVAKSLGDGILALFGAPIAHEDHPQRALYAALRMQEAMRLYADRVRLEKEIPLQIRVGIHTGEVLVRSIETCDLRADYEPIGQSIHLASRMEGIATPGSIVVSEATYRLAEGYFEFKTLGAIPVKGVAQPLEVYEVTGVGPLRTRLQVSAQRGLAPFVGRQPELEALSRALARSRRSHGQVLGVVGEPGVGKSRLFYEFQAIARSDCLVLETFSVSHGKAFAFLPLIELLKDYLQIGPQDDERVRREKVTGKVLTLDRDLEDCLPFLFFLLGVSEPETPLAQMDAMLRRQRTFEAICRLLLRESLNQPLVVVFEDLQWLDSETGLFLEHLIANLASARLLLLVNYRPEYRPQWGERRFFTQLRLDPLGQDEAQELLDSLLGEDASLASLKPLVMSQTEGNPFFLEEVVQALVEEQVLIGEPGRYRLEQAPELLQIPTTVQGVLTARIDRLNADEKVLLQTLAVIGKAFPWSLMLQVVDMTEAGLRLLLSRLQAGEFLYERPAFPEVEYTFKHALTQEVAYASLPMGRRSELHERTARAIETLFPDQLEDRCNELAHHYGCSGNVLKAVEYLRRAGEQALHRSANAEAVGHLQQALELLGRLPETPERARRDLAVLLTLGPAWMALRGYAAREVETTYRCALELCSQVGTVQEHFTALIGLDAYYVVCGELEAGRRIAEQLLDLALEAGDTDFLLEARGALGAVLQPLGELEPAREQLEQGFALYEPSQHRAHAFIYGLDPGVLCLSYLALTQALCAEPADELSRKSLSLAQQLAHPLSLAFALLMAAQTEQLLQHEDRVRAPAEAAIELSMEQGFRSCLANGRILLGWELAQEGSTDQGIAMIREGVTAYRATGSEMFVTYFLGLLADALMRAGRFGEALTVLEEALLLVQKMQEHFYEAELHRLRGSALQALPPGARAPYAYTPKACYRKAIEVAKGQGAHLLERQAMLSLAHHQLQLGERHEARQLLTQLCGRAGASDESSVLASARALLAQLG